MRLSTADAAAMYAEALRIMRRERPTAVLYPTMGGGATISERYDHHLPLAQEGLIDMGVIDPGSVNLSSSGADGAPPTGDYVYVNSPADIGYMMDVCRRARHRPELRDLRAGLLAHGAHLPTVGSPRAALADEVLLLRRRVLRPGHPDVLCSADRRSARSLPRDAGATLRCRGASRCSADRFSIHRSPSVRSNAAAISVSVSRTTPVGRPTSIRSPEQWPCAKSWAGRSRPARRRAELLAL